MKNFYITCGDADLRPDSNNGWISGKRYDKKGRIHRPGIPNKTHSRHAFWNQNYRYMCGSGSVYGLAVRVGSGFKSSNPYPKRSGFQLPETYPPLKLKIIAKTFSTVIPTYLHRLSKEPIA